ncbi:MAG: hypothetical protein NXI24_20415 [bacterium]|nr:hypothetical protein [bacterium]
MKLPRINFRIVANYFLYAHEIVTRRWRRALGATAIFGVIMTGIHLAAIQIVLSVVHMRDQQNVLLSVLTLPFTAYFLGGLVQFMLRLVREPEVPTAWRWLFLTDPRRYLHMLLFLVYYYFLYVVLVKVTVDFNEYQGLIQIRLVAGLFLFLWLMARLIFAPLYVIDQGLGVRAALKSSYLLTTGRTRRTLLLSLAFLATLWLGVFAAGIGAIYTLAIVLCGVILLFDNYSDAPAAADRLHLIEFSTSPDRGPVRKKSGARRKKKRSAAKKKSAAKAPKKES